MTDTAPSFVTRQVRPTTGSDLRLLTLLIILLVAVPSSLVFAPLGGAGGPAQLLGITMFALWCFRTVAGTAPRGRRPVHTALALFLGAVMASYIAANVRPIVPIEVSAADRGLLSIVAFVGVALIVADGPHTPWELDTFLRRLCLAGGLLATLGLVQFATKQPLINYIQIPGLSVNSDLAGIIGRNGLTRPAGTAVHPIEFGAVLTAILPISLHYALNDTDRSALARWFPVLAIAVAVPISISRSAIVSAIVGLLILLPTWTGSQRRRAYAVIVMILGVVYLFVPGLLGTLSGLFTGISSDTSAKSRTGSFDLAFDFIGRAPLFGRGFRTFLPAYRILDDQYLGLLIDVGFVGLAATVTMIVTSIVTSQVARGRSSDPATRSLGQALTASIAAAAVSFALYDLFSFSMSATTFFIVLGASAALYRLTPRSIVDRTQVAVA